MDSINNMNPWEMVLAHRYFEAVSEYDKLLSRDLSDEDRAGYLAGEANAFLCLGRLEEALVGYQHANELTTIPVYGKYRPYLNDVGVVQWLLGNKAAGIQTLRQSIIGIIKGKIKYADNAGGVSQGVLLWYAGLTAGDSAAQNEALAYLKRLGSRAQAEFWPGPLARFAIGSLRFAEVLHKLAKTSDLDECIHIARTDLLRRRRLCQALFYDGVQQRAQGDNVGCLKRMKECNALENPILELEWYLARAEVQSNDRLDQPPDRGHRA